MADRMRNAEVSIDAHDLMADIELPATVDDYATVVWQTSDAAVITADGHITRPPYGKPKATATPSTPAN